MAADWPAPAGATYRSPAASSTSRTLRARASRAKLPDLLGDLAPVHASGQDHVAEQKIDVGHAVQER